MSSLYTERLELVPLSLEMAEAVILGDRPRAARAAEGLTLPAEWPNRALVERAFYASVELLRADPERRLWGDRLCVTRSDRRVVGSVIFHGRPDEDGIAEVGYGIEDGSQGDGLATEATKACVDWALQHDFVRAVRATTFVWHRPSLRIMEKLGMSHVGTEQHETMGELLVYEIKKGL